VAGVSVIGFLAIVSGLIDLTGTGDDTSKLLIFGSLSILVFSFLVRYLAEAKLSKSESLLGVTCGFAMCILTSSFVYLITGDSSSFSDSLFESSAALTTTSLSVLDTDTFGNGMLFFRSFSQLVGSFAAILTAVTLLPISGQQQGSTSSELKLDKVFLHRRFAAIQNIALVYLFSTIVMTIFLTFGKMAFYDSLLLSLSTVSTGGFSNDSSLLADPSVQWILIVGMIVAGTSFLIIWRLATGRFTQALRSSELRTYLALITVSTILFYLWTDSGSHSSLRQSLLFVSSSISTSGFHFLPFGNWSLAISFLLLLLIAIGPMSLSNGGGFQILRLRILFGVSVRELVRQLHPRAIVKIRVGEEIIDDKNVRQVVVFQFLFLSIVFTTSLLLTFLGVSVYDAFVSSVHALTTAGPIRGVDGSIIDIASFSSAERLSLLPAMLSGRLYLLPVFVTLGHLLSESRNFLRPRRRYLRWRSSSKS
jgi:trk system potassium uptake protein TrkH